MPDSLARIDRELLATIDDFRGWRQHFAKPVGRQREIGDVRDRRQSLATLDRGYAIVTDAGGKVITDSGTVARGSAIDVRLARGGLAATVDKIKPSKS